MSRKILYLSIVIFLCGCATVHYNLNNNYILDTDFDKSIVFGEVKFTGFQRHMNGAIGMQFIRMEDNKKFDMHATSGSFIETLKALGNEGLNRFFFELPTGIYQIVLIERGNWELKPKMVKFIVPEAGKIYYIGQLEIMALEKPWLLSFSLAYDQRVVNNYDENVKIFQEKYPNMNQEIEIKLMKAKTSQNNTNADFSSDIPYVPSALY